MMNVVILSTYSRWAWKIFTGEENVKMTFTHLNYTKWKCFSFGKSFSFFIWGLDAGDDFRKEQESVGIKALVKFWWYKLRALNLENVSKFSNAFELIKDYNKSYALKAA